MKMVLREDGTGRLVRESGDRLNVVFVCCDREDSVETEFDIPVCGALQIPCATCGKIYTFAVDDLFKNMRVRTDVNTLEP